VHEQNLHSLQSAHRNAADECLMLRYKNSLLERILLEKGMRATLARPGPLPAARRGRRPSRPRQASSARPSTVHR